MTPWSLYNLTARDQAGSQLRPAFGFINTSFGGVTNVADFPAVPHDQMLLLTRISAASWDSGAVGTPLGLQWEIRELSGTVHFRETWWADSTQKNAARQSNQATGSPICYIGPNHFIRTTTYYDVAPSTGLTTWNFAGLYVPNGTFALS